MAIVHADTDGFRNEVLDAKGTVLVDFFATWCGPCKMLGPVLEKVADKHPDVKVVKVDVDQASDLAIRYGVQGVPTMIVFKDGQIVNKAVGYKPSLSPFQLRCFHLHPIPGLKIKASRSHHQHHADEGKTCEDHGENGVPYAAFLQVLLEGRSHLLQGEDVIYDHDVLCLFHESDLLYGLMIRHSPRHMMSLWMSSHLFPYFSSRRSTRFL